MRHIEHGADVERIRRVLIERCDESASHTDCVELWRRHSKFGWRDLPEGDDELAEVLSEALQRVWYS